MFDAKSQKSKRSSPTKGQSLIESLGGVVRLGFDYMINDSNGIFLSADKIFVDTRATGNAVELGGAPVKADIDLDPLILQIGWVHRF